MDKSHYYGSWNGVSSIKTTTTTTHWCFFRVLNHTTYFSLSQSVYVLMHVNFFKYKLAAVLTFHSLLGMISYGTTSLAVLSHGAIYLVWSFNFWVCRRNSMVRSFKWLYRNGGKTRPRKTSRSNSNRSCICTMESFYYYDQNSFRFFFQI